MACYLAREWFAAKAAPTGDEGARRNGLAREQTWSEANPDGRWRAYDYADLVNRDKASLDIFWLKDESLSDSDNLPAPEVIAQEIVDDLEAALEQFREILSVRRNIATGLSSVLDGIKQYVEGNADVFDACLCLVAAKDFLDGLTDHPKNMQLARREGWIWLRRPADKTALRLEKMT